MKSYPIGVYGNSAVYLEMRLRNQAARAFYTSLGYEEIQRIPGYYKKRETAVRMARDLWSN